ncbi:MAG: alanine--glyoxylate aminotransferase family protein [Saprospiraceae bacterium]|nr:alanine--glyoxylate aminotransferase family protein [Saprospiraceae bacterium]
MSQLRSQVDPNGLLEYSVVYTDRALNHMSQTFQQVMRDISNTLKDVYQADSVAVVPGSGTFGMEAVARQLGTRQKCLVMRNGWFSYRWTQIFERASIPSEEILLKAHSTAKTAQAGWAPPDLDQVMETIHKERPAVVFAPHVETSAGMILPDDYISSVATATHEVGGLFVLDCIASGTIWVDMKALGVDVLISAPQKGWSGSPCCALVMMSSDAENKVRSTTSTSYSCDLRKWLEIMDAYLGGGHAYHATMPTDGLRKFHEVMLETKALGWDYSMSLQWELGLKARDLLTSKGYQSVAAAGFASPSVVVCHTHDKGISSGKKFMEAGIQIAGGVPLKCDEPSDFQTFRLGFFGLDKLQNIDETIRRLKHGLEQV